MTLPLVPKILFSLRLWLTQTLVLFCVYGNLAMAHQTGNSYLTVSEADGRLQLEIDFIVRDLGNLLQAPGQPNEPPPAPDKLLSLQAPITTAIQKSLTIEVDEQAIPLEFLTQSVVLHNDGLYVRQRFSGSTLPADAKFIVVRYEFFTQNDKLGRAIFKLVMRNDEISSVFDQTDSAVCARGNQTLVNHRTVHQRRCQAHLGRRRPFAVFVDPAAAGLDADHTFSGCLR